MLGNLYVSRLKHRSGVILSLLLGANLLIWLIALLVLRNHPLLLCTAMLAYVFGLRHAWDADHIAAIDNATRKLIQDGQRPLLVGFFFSLGHSTIVVLLSALTALAAPVIHSHSPQFRHLGEIIGTSLSSAFLLLIAAINLFILVSIIKCICQRNSLRSNEFNPHASPTGFLARLLRPAIRLVDQSWKMYLVGFVFGLGFDTATEVALLGLSATTAASDLPIGIILIFPLLFTAGMCLIDTADGILMLGAYSWAAVDPLRRVYYNLIITAVSVLVAIGIGASQLLWLFNEHLHHQGQFWNALSFVQDHFGAIGIILVALFALCWLASATISRLTKRRGITADYADFAD